MKKLSAESKQGVREFLTEIETISNVKHPNLVQLLGCCVHGPDRILVYEYLENNSIDRALLGMLVHSFRNLKQIKFSIDIQCVCRSKEIHKIGLGKKVCHLHGYCKRACVSS